MHTRWSRRWRVSRPCRLRARPLAMRTARARASCSWWRPRTSSTGAPRPATPFLRELPPPIIAHHCWIPKHFSTFEKVLWLDANAREPLDESIPSELPALSTHRPRAPRSMIQQRAAQRPPVAALGRHPFWLSASERLG
jgi:hypothetical protein